MFTTLLQFGFMSVSLSSNLIVRAECIKLIWGTFIYELLTPYTEWLCRNLWHVFGSLEEADVCFLVMAGHCRQLFLSGAGVLSR